MSNKESVVKKEETQNKPDFLNSFIGGARKGLNISMNTILPTVVFSFSLLQILQITGILNIIGVVLSPIMGIFGLPGEAAVPMILTFISVTGATASTAGLVANGILDPTQCAVMIPYLFLCGSYLTYMGRILSTSGIPTKHYKVIFAIGAIIGVLSLFIMRAITLFM